MNISSLTQLPNSNWIFHLNFSQGLTLYGLTASHENNGTQLIMEPFHPFRLSSELEKTIREIVHEKIITQLQEKE